MEQARASAMAIAPPKRGGVGRLFLVGYRGKCRGTFAVLAVRVAAISA